MLGNFFRRPADLKQRVHRKQNVAIDSAASSGGQGKYSFPWFTLETALSIFDVRLVVIYFFFENMLVKTKEASISAKS
jgi:hypothetical protein